MRSQPIHTSFFHDREEAGNGHLRMLRKHKGRGRPNPDLACQGKFPGSVVSMVRPEAQVGISKVDLEQLKAAHCGRSTVWIGER